jgi:hypothetical protein
VDPKPRGMRPLIQHRLKAAAILPIACAMIGWSLGRFSMRPYRNEAVTTRDTQGITGTPSRKPGMSWQRSGSECLSTCGSYRDPFDGVHAPASVGSSDPWKGFEALRLSAIWIHPNDPVAVIDGRMVRPGDGIGGFRVAHCVPDGVWITGTLGSRRLFLQAKPELKPGNPRS